MKRTYLIGTLTFYCLVILSFYAMKKLQFVNEIEPYLGNSKDTRKFINACRRRITTNNEVSFILLFLLLHRNQYMAYEKCTVLKLKFNFYCNFWPYNIFIQFSIKRLFSSYNVCRQTQSITFIF
jgi:hypothetical protein